MNDMAEFGRKSLAKPQAESKNEPFFKPCQWKDFGIACGHESVVYRENRFLCGYHHAIVSGSKPLPLPQRAPLTVQCGHHDHIDGRFIRCTHGSLPGDKPFCSEHVRLHCHD